MGNLWFDAVKVVFFQNLTLAICICSQFRGHFCLILHPRENVMSSPLLTLVDRLSQGIASSRGFPALPRGFSSRAETRCVHPGWSGVWGRG